MSFEAPVRLGLLVLPLVLAAWYAVTRLRGEATLARFSALEAARQASRRTSWKRHVSAVLALVGIAGLVVAFARPVMAVEVPVEQATIVLAIDVSLSMAADDVAPSRLEAAQDAARRFVDLAPETLRVGLVAFAGNALPVAAPTADRGLVREAIGRLGLGQGTAVGEAVFASLDQLRLSGPPEGVPAAIVVLSDGETTMGREDAEAAAAAAQAGVPVYTIAFGTEAGEIAFEGETIPVPVNQGALADVAAATGGSFFEAASESELAGVFDSLESQIAYEEQDRQVTDRFVGIALATLVGAVALSIRWFDRAI
ncbi:MAG: VWA domain-containing protein [Acidimicrobiia bacterium]|nr:VWA domain-containing protein [Acidimicrobiia bacterium]MDH4308250.1 VWA domain-containing protein [Acidimicrobiia bacterium]MDH5293614.1 VWA domain-containing protein [Acidimicrobiia bacterium]